MEDIKKIIFNYLNIEDIGELIKDDPRIEDLKCGYKLPIFEGDIRLLANCWNKKDVENLSTTFDTLDVLTYCPRDIMNIYLDLVDLPVTSDHMDIIFKRNITKLKKLFIHDTYNTILYSVKYNDLDSIIHLLNTKDRYTKDYFEELLTTTIVWDLLERESLLLFDYHPKLIYKLEDRKRLHKICKNNIGSVGVLALASIKCWKNIMKQYKKIESFDDVCLIRNYYVEFNHRIFTRINKILSDHSIYLTSNENYINIISFGELSKRWNLKEKFDANEDRKFILEISRYLENDFGLDIPNRDEWIYVIVDVWTRVEKYFGEEEMLYSLKYCFSPGSNMFGSIDYILGSDHSEDKVRLLEKIAKFVEPGTKFQPGYDDWCQDWMLRNNFTFEEEEDEE